MKDSMQYYPVDQIAPNPYQPRQHEDPEVVAEIAASIERNGLMQVPAARLVDGKPQLAFGHTRLAAYRLLAGQGKADFESMPLTIQDLTDLQMFEMAVGENIKRRDLNPIEQAAAMRYYLDHFQKTSEEAAEFFHISAETIRGKIRLLNLAPDAQEKLAAGELSEAGARKILAVQRVAPQEAEKIGKALGPAMAGTLDDAVQDAIRGNKAVVEMWARYHDAEDGKARGGEDLWPLDWKNPELPMLELTELHALFLNHGNQALSKDVRAAVDQLFMDLLAGKAIDPVQYPELKRPTLELVTLLSNPPACTACLLHMVNDGGHYCGERRCHDRKKAAWLGKDLKALSKKLGLAIYNPKTDPKPVDTYDSTYGDYAETFKRRINAKDADLRLMVRRLNPYSKYPATGHHWIAVVDLSEAHKKNLERERAARREQKAKEPSWQEQQKRWEQERKIKESSEAFIKKAAYPAFAPAFDGIRNVAAFLAVIRESNSRIAKLSKTGKIKWIQLQLAEAALDHLLTYQLKEQGPVKVAQHLQGVATAWGVKLPADWLEVAKGYVIELEPPKEKSK